MKTITCHGAKDLRIDTGEVAAPGPGEILVQIEAGGICGSDLHYYNHGGFGTVRLKEPMILGHEVAGTVEALGSGVEGLTPGQRVAVSPSRPCGTCQYCQRGMQNHCMNMRFYGSAMPFPHIQGAFREFVVADASQCVVADGLSDAQAALGEPLSVVLHAAKQAGDLRGANVLVTGCGPIGLIAVAVARMSGAARISATDLTRFTLEKAREMGADAAHNVAEDPTALTAYTAGKGKFDVLFECTGVAAALTSSIPALRPGATIVQLGLGGDMTLPVQAMTAKELSLKGSFRFHHEFPTAIALQQAGRLDLSPLLTHRFGIDEAIQAFETASDRNAAIKVTIGFT